MNLNKMILLGNVSANATGFQQIFRFSACGRSSSQLHGMIRRCLFACVCHASRFLTLLEILKFRVIEALLLDLSVLKNLWTEAGAREVFARLVTHCVKSIHPDAQTIRPDPGDDGIDVIHGQLSGKSNIWQCKFFIDGLGNSQKAQIRASWKACIGSTNIAKMTKWTLCVPSELSVEELGWWEKWKAKSMKENPGTVIQIWTLSDLEKFYSSPELQPIFDLALKRSNGTLTLDAVLEGMDPKLFSIESMPDAKHLNESIFVKKLEIAGIDTHRAARVAFYNFELGSV